MLQETTVTADTTIGPGSYLVNSDIVVNAGAVLTLASGTTLRFAEDTGLFVESDGALHAVGTPEDRVLLTGKTAARGSWIGLGFNGSHSDSNRLEFVTIEYGGAATEVPNARSARYPANLTIEGDTLLAIANCVLQESETFGFNFAPNAVGAAVTAFANNTIALNTLGAGRLEAWHAGFLDAASSYTGNDIDVVFVGGEGPTHTLADVTWPALEVPYFLASNLVVSHMLTIADGAGLLLGSEVSIIPGESGGIYVNASSESGTRIARANNIAPPPDHPLHSQYTLPADFGSQGPVGPSWNDYPTYHYNEHQGFYSIWDMTLTLDSIFSAEMVEFFNNLPPWWKPPLPQKWTLDEIDYEYIPANAFYMGSPANEVGHLSYEAPVHRVQMTYGFYLSKTEVTQKQWRHVMGT